MNQRIQSDQQYRQVEAETQRFDPLPELSTSLDPASAFEELQRRLTEDRCSMGDVYRDTEVRWAAAEASSLSWSTGFPLLFFPALFEEKSNLALDRARRQEKIYARSRKLLGLPD